MPYSSTSGKSAVQRLVERIAPSTGLDVGCGSGTYAKMFPGVSWSGVEIWEPYVEQFGLRDLYPRLDVADARDWEPDDCWQVAIAGDVLEHMTPDEAKALLAKLRYCSEYVIVSIPLGHYPQGEYEGNPYERHVKDDWSDAEVREVFGEPLYSEIDNEIGVYLYGSNPLPLRICVYAICNGEEHFIKRFCDAAKDADMIVIADTGSTDGADATARECGATVHHINIKPWRFDDARNAALALLPDDIDVCFSLDIDEVLQPGWREEVERVWVPGASTRLYYQFDWSGNGHSFTYDKVHARHGYRWTRPCHEVIVPYGIEEVRCQTDKLLVVHQPDPAKSRGQYLPLLEMSIREDPHDPRNAFYYARELSFHGHWQRAIEECERYLALPGADWPNERCYAYRVIARCYEAIGDWDSAMKAARMGVIEAPGTREPWCEIAKFAYQRQQWPECYGAAMSALAIEQREWVYTVDPEVWGSLPHDYASIAAWNMGLKDAAIEQVKLAIEKNPEDERLRNNLTCFTQ